MNVDWAARPFCRSGLPGGLFGICVWGVALITEWGKSCRAWTVSGGCAAGGGPTEGEQRLSPLTIQRKAPIAQSVRLVHIQFKAHSTESVRLVYIATDRPVTQHRRKESPNKGTTPERVD